MKKDAFVEELKASERLWKEIILKYPDHKTRAEKLLEKGVREVGKGHIVFDIVLSCEALGEAEQAESPEMMAEAYKRIGMLWGTRFPALSLSIWQKAEGLYQEIGNEKEIELLKPNLALGLFLTAEKFKMVDAEMASMFHEEAKKLALELCIPDGMQDPAMEASFNYTKGTILRDARMLAESLAFYEKEELWDGTIQILDEMIRIALDGKQKDEALRLMGKVRDYSIKGGDPNFAGLVEERMSHIDVLENGPRFILPKEGEFNLLDVLDLIGFFEERVIFNKNYKAFEYIGFPPMKEGRFFLTDKGQLFPTFRESMRVYRGQRRFVDECQPSLWRKDMDANKQLIERLKYVEFERMLYQLPQCLLFANGIMVNDPDGFLHHMPLKIDTLGLAQHYGIKTELLDLTADKWAAAFFACTNYHSDTDVYEPVLETENGEGKGVMYCFNILERDLISNKIRVVGAQPFARPTEQAAFMVNMIESDNFNNICQDRVEFKQNPGVSCLVYHFANRADRLFPKEYIQEKAHELVLYDENRFPADAVGRVRRLFYSGMSEEEFSQLVQTSGIIVEGGPVLELEEDEKIVTPEVEKAFENLTKRIDVRWFTTVPYQN